MSRMRLRIAQRLKDAQNTCAMLTTFNEIDMRYLVLFWGKTCQVKCAPMPKTKCLIYMLKTAMQH